MEKNFTKNLLVKYLFNEVTQAEKFQVEEALYNNWEFHELYDDLDKAYRTLPKVQFAPKASTIQNILGYSSERTALEPQL